MNSTLFNLPEDPQSTLAKLFDFSAGLPCRDITSDFKCISLNISRIVIEESQSSLERQLRIILGESTINKIREDFNRVIELISEIDLGKLFVTITSSDSIFFRFSPNNSSFEFKLEVFYDYDKDDNSDIEATLHIYKMGVKVAAHYGSVEYLYGIIRKKVLSVSTIFKDELPRTLSASPVFADSY